MDIPLPVSILGDQVAVREDLESSLLCQRIKSVLIHNRETVANQAMPAGFEFAFGKFVPLRRGGLRSRNLRALPNLNFAA